MKILLIIYPNSQSVLVHINTRKLVINTFQFQLPSAAASSLKNIQWMSTESLSSDVIFKQIPLFLEDLDSVARKAKVVVEDVSPLAFESKQGKTP
jgi:hypothetical protein